MPWDGDPNFLEATASCFSGAGGRSVLASAAQEISGSLDEKGHGAFTYFLLSGLNAGKKSPTALSEFLTPLVQDEARRLNRDQTPQLFGDGSWSLR